MCRVLEYADTHFSQCIEDLLFVRDVPQVKRDIMVPLDDVKDKYNVTAREEPLYDVTADEPAATNNEVDVFLSCHCGTNEKVG